jgi:hypothetical protein
VREDIFLVYLHIFSASVEDMKKPAVHIFAGMEKSTLQRSPVNDENPSVILWYYIIESFFSLLRYANSGGPCRRKKHPPMWHGSLCNSNVTQL